MLSLTNNLNNPGSHTKWKIPSTPRYPSLKERIVLVTGGATGIGDSVVTHFARQGSRVTFLDVQDEPARQLVDSLTAEGCPKPIYIRCDLTDLGALKAAVDQVLATHGTVDVLVNNAANDQRHSIEEVTPEFWDHSIATNLRPHFFTMQAVLPAMRNAGRGSIINMSSIAWMIPYHNCRSISRPRPPSSGSRAPSPTSCGASNIRVNAVLPGAIATERQSASGIPPSIIAEILLRQALNDRLSPTKSPASSSSSPPTTPAPLPTRAM